MAKKIAKKSVKKQNSQKRPPKKKREKSGRRTASSSLPLLVADDSALDASQKDRANAVRYFANRIAHKINASIDLLRVDDLLAYLSNMDASQNLIAPYVNEQKAALQKQTQDLTVPSRPLLVYGQVVPELLALTRKKPGYELAVVGTHGRTGISRLLLGSTAEEVIRQSKTPVMTVGPIAQKHARTSGDSTQWTLVVPTDLGPNSRRAEEYALKLAKKLGAKVHLIHCLHESLHPVQQTAYALPNIPFELEKALHELRALAARNIAKRMAPFKKGGLEVSTEIHEAAIPADEAILAAVQRLKADLVVMGTHGRSALAGAFFGRTARGMILAAPVPVITVHSKS